MGDIRGHLREGQYDWHPLECVKQPDCTYVLKVDTELSLDAGNIYISNIKVGSVDQTQNNIRWLKVLDDGTLVAMANPTELYRVADVDDNNGAGNPSGVNYYGFVDVGGGWYIMEEDVSGSTATYRYFKGDTNYATNWGVRTGFSYDYFFNIF